MCKSLWTYSRLSGMGQVVLPLKQVLSQFRVQGEAQSVLQLSPALQAPTQAHPRLASPSVQLSPALSPQRVPGQHDRSSAAL